MCAAYLVLIYSCFYSVCAAFPFPPLSWTVSTLGHFSSVIHKRYAMKNDVGEVQTFSLNFRCLSNKTWCWRRVKFVFWSRCKNRASHLDCELNTQTRNLRTQRNWIFFNAKFNHLIQTSAEVKLKAEKCSNKQQLETAAVKDWQKRDSQVGDVNQLQTSINDSGGGGHQTAGTGITILTRTESSKPRKMQVQLDYTWVAKDVLKFVAFSTEVRQTWSTVRSSNLRCK